MDLLAQRFLSTNLLEKMLQTIRSLHWRIAVDMPRMVTSDSLAKWSSIFLFGSSRKPQHLLGGRSHFRREQLRPVRWHFDHRKFIGKDGRRRGAPWSAFGRVSRCCFSWLWGCGRFIVVVVSRLHTSCLMDLLVHSFLNTSGTEDCR